MAITSCTVVGVFRDDGTARQVADELANRGYQRDRIHVTGGRMDASPYARGGAGLSGSDADDDSGGGISGFFRRLFGADDDTDVRDRYADAVKRGHAVVTVDTDEVNQDNIVDIMERYDPVDIDQHSESSFSGTGTGYTETETGSADTRSDYTETRTGTGDRSIPVIKEDLQVGKRQVDRGGVRVFSRMEREPVEQQVHLREERVRVDRRPANRPATEADIRMSEQVIEVTEMSEEPVIGKQTRVVEEVVVGKEVHDRTETVRDDLRRTDVHVEQMGGSRQDTIDYQHDETYQPAYRYGSQMASDPRYRGRRWDDIESDLRTEYSRNYPDSAWERMKDAVRQGWDKVTGRR